MTGSPAIIFILLAYYYIYISNHSILINISLSKPNCGLLESVLLTCYQDELRTTSVLTSQSSDVVGS